MSEVNSKQYSDLFKVNCLNSKYVRKVDKKAKHSPIHRESIYKRSRKVVQHSIGCKYRSTIFDAFLTTSVYKAEQLFH